MFTDIDMGRPLAWRALMRGTVLRIGCFSIAIDVPATESDLIDEISDLYAFYPQEDREKLTDFAITLKCPNIWRAVFGRQIQAYINGRAPYQPMPQGLGLPMLESTINWVIGVHSVRFLLLHAAAVERNGRAVVMPGPSGAGKSTLCISLVSRGWRLLSDEFAMVQPSDGLLQPHPRPISLKNTSIDMMAERLPDAHFSKRYEGTSKGTVAFLRAPREAIEKADETVRPAVVVFPRYKSDTRAELKPLERAHAFMRLVDNAANYFTMSEIGFETLASLVETCDHYTLSYNTLDDAISLIESLEPVPQGP